MTYQTLLRVLQYLDTNAKRLWNTYVKLRQRVHVFLRQRKKLVSDKMAHSPCRNILDHQTVDFIHAKRRLYMLWEQAVSLDVVDKIVPIRCHFTA